MKNRSFFLVAFLVSAGIGVSTAQQPGRPGVARPHMDMGGMSMPQTNPGNGGGTVSKTPVPQGGSGMGQAGGSQSGSGRTQIGTCQGTPDTGQSTMSSGGMGTNPNPTCQDLSGMSQNGTCQGDPRTTQPTMGAESEPLRQKMINTMMNRHQMNHMSVDMGPMSKEHGESRMDGHSMKNGDSGADQSNGRHLLRKYTNQMANNPHGPDHSGMIWSNTLQDLRRQLGAAGYDQLILTSFQYLQEGQNSLNGLSALLKADNETFGGRYRSTIIRVFQNRGFAVDDSRNPRNQENSASSEHHNPYFK